MIDPPIGIISISPVVFSIHNLTMDWWSDYKEYKAVMGNTVLRKCKDDISFACLLSYDNFVTSFPQRR